MCSGAIVLYKIPRVVVGENKTFLGAEDYMRSQGIQVEVVQDEECIQMMTDFIRVESRAVERGHRGLKDGAERSNIESSFVRRSDRAGAELAAGCASITTFTRPWKTIRIGS